MGVFPLGLIFPMKPFIFFPSRGPMGISSFVSLQSFVLWPYTLSPTAIPFRSDRSSIILFSASFATSMRVDPPSFAHMLPEASRMSSMWVVASSWARAGLQEPAARKKRRKSSTARYTTERFTMTSLPENSGYIQGNSSMEERKKKRRTRDRTVRAREKQEN